MARKLNFSKLDGVFSANANEVRYRILRSEESLGEWCLIIMGPGRRCASYIGETQEECFKQAHKEHERRMYEDNQSQQSA